MILKLGGGVACDTRTHTPREKPRGGAPVAHREAFDSPARAAWLDTGGGRVRTTTQGRRYPPPKISLRGPKRG